nr:hypothetical protein GCM10020093_102970 [Planobispora longispora]
MAGMAERKYGVPAPETRTTIRSEDWGCDDLSDRAFERVAFVDVDMTEATSRGRPSPSARSATSGSTRPSTPRARS